MSSTNGHLRLLIAADDWRLRHALSMFFDIQEGFKVVGAAPDPVQTQALCHQLKPHVLLLDTDIQPHHPVAFIGSLCQQNKTTKVVVLASERTGITLQQVVQVGAAKYIEKGILASEIVTIIREVYPHP